MCGGCCGDGDGDDDIAIDRPKYWSSNDERVMEGAKTAVLPISPRSLCGKYYFVWEGDQLMEEFNPDEYDGWLKLTYEGDSKPEADILDDIHGSASFGSTSGTFKGLSLMSEHPNCWVLLNSTLLEDDDKELLEDGKKEFEDVLDTVMHDVTALEVQDDHGHPFVQFVYEAIGAGYSSDCLTYIGKKHVEGHPKGLTDTERSRLGMDLDAEEVENLMKENEKDKDIPVQSQLGTPLIAGAKRKAEDHEEEGDIPDANQRPSVKPKLEHP
ncbi:hypothetical protein DFH29DRAFT_636964 [Suillus ampliporus]|nr:hypothetical protein DFH29DRAFT_636964 [Suillus ampliporus]